MRILQFSGSNENVLRHVEAVAIEISPDLVICTALSAASATGEEYRALANRFARLGMDYLVLPGRNDDASLFFAAFGRRYRIDPGHPYLDRFVRAGGATLLLVDARDGTLVEQQQRWLESTLTDVAAAIARGDRTGPVILCTQTAAHTETAGSLRSVLSSLAAAGFFGDAVSTAENGSSRPDTQVPVAIVASGTDEDDLPRASRAGSAGSSGFAVYTTGPGAVRLIDLDPCGGITTTVRKSDGRQD
ncbi:MAG: metallophosphoesterase family protein [Alkalispirochaeta sp.]